MKTDEEKSAQEEKYSAFWERMARHYPLPFEEKTLADTLRVIDLVRSRGVTIDKTAILDIGCGTGIYTLPLARQAATVTGLDDSQAMIAHLSDVIASTGFQNVDTVKASWKQADIRALGFEKAFDIAWVSMSPAVQTWRDFENMEHCARKWCVYIGWGRKRENALMEAIFKSHDLDFGPPPGVGAAYDMLVHSGRTPSLDYFDASWEWCGTIADALEEMTGFVEMHGGRARRDLIEQILAPHAQDGLIRHTTEVEEGLMVWPVD